MIPILAAAKDHVVVDSLTQITTTLTAIAVSLGLLWTVVLRVMDGLEAKRKERKENEKAELKALLDQEAAKKRETKEKEDAERIAAAVVEVKREAARAAKAAEGAVKEAQVSRVEVKAALEASAAVTTSKLDETLKMGERNHLLLNSTRGVALRSVAELSRWKADQTRDTPEWEANNKAANKAEKEYREHEEQQAKVDAKDARDAKEPCL